MRKGKSEGELISLVKDSIPLLMSDSDKVAEISTHLQTKHNLSTGKLMYYLNDPVRLEEADINLIALLAEQLYLKLDIQSLILQNWFLEPEIKKFRGYRAVGISTDEVKFPLVFENVVNLGDGVYQVAMDLSLIARLYKHNQLTYNFEIQREGAISVVNGKTVKKIKVYRKNVNEIKERVLQNKLKKTAIAYNCRVGSTEDESEHEILFDDYENTLTITKGTVIEILDGTHRTMGIYEAYMENPNIQGKMTVLFSNYTEAQAKEYQVELAKATPFNKTRARQLADSTHHDELVNRLKSEGMLKDQISTLNVFAKGSYITTFETLADTFKVVWNPTKRSEIYTIQNYFNQYLEVLFDEYEDFIDDKDSLIFNKLTFLGHIIIAKYMHDNNISLDKVKSFVDTIYIDNKNEIVNTLNTLDSRKYNKQISTMIDYFKKVKLDEVDK